jgi:hypothetical protein
MMTKFIGHLLFPRLPEWEPRRRLNVVVIVFLTTVLFTAALGATLYWMNAKH